MDRNNVILVDEFDNEVGVQEKMKAHQEGNLHRAISVLIFNKKGELLIQKRAKTKYHSPNLWSNTVCTHPQKDELTKEAAERRLQEELGFTCTLAFTFSFIYKVSLENGLIEHEFDHVFYGRYDGLIYPNPSEVSEVKWVNLEWLKEDIKLNPMIYTEWFKLLIVKI